MIRPPLRERLTVLTCGTLLLATLLLQGNPLPAHAQEGDPIGGRNPGAQASDTLPHGVVARVFGHEIREVDLLERVAVREGTTERGKTVLDLMIEDECVRQEAERQGVTASEAEAQAYMEKIDERLRADTAGAKGLVDVFKAGESNEREFKVIAREYIIRQKMARAVFGLPPGEDVPEHRMKYWVKMVRHRAGVHTEALTADQVANVGGELVQKDDGTTAIVGGVFLSRTDFARKLTNRLPPEATQTVLEQMVYEVAASARLRQQGVEITEEDLDAEMGRLRTRFRNDPRVAGTGVTFDDFLMKTRGFGESTLRRDPAFRTQVGMRAMLLKGVGQSELREYWESNRDAYGERALVRTIFVPSSEGGAKFEMLSREDGYKIALKAKIAVGELTGEYDDKVKGAPLNEAVTQVAKGFSKKDEKEAAGEPMAWTRAALAGVKALEDAVFNGPLGVLQGPLWTDIGHYLVLVEERRPAPKFEELTETLREHLLARRLDQFRLRLRSDPDNVVVRELRETK